jgi:RNase P/RNase MRP subunit POP5
MKSLIPSHKENKRYLLVTGKNLEIKKDIEKAILEFVGALGLSKCGLSFIKSKKDSCIICINRESVDIVRASFVIFSKKMEVAKISGTLKGLEFK